MFEKNALFFFESAYQNFLASASKAGNVKRFYKLAGRTFCLHFSGGALVGSITPALQHLEIENTDEIDLTICIWDSVSTDTPPVELPWTREFCDVRGEVLGYNSEQITTVLDIHTKALHVFYQERKIALYWIKDEKNLPWWVCGSPLQLILHWWMRTQGSQLTHAAVVGYPQGGILFAGKSGAGKSTTSLACMKAGMKYVSEDYCLLANTSAYSVYNSAKIGEKTLRWFPELEKQVSNPERAKGEKAFLFHHQFQPEKILLQCPLKALITLTIEETGDTWIEPIESMAAVGALSISTMWQLTHTGPAVFRYLKNIAETLPCYLLHLGGDFMQAPKILERLL